MEPYPMKWFRLYDEALNDPKVQRLPDAAFKCWINLLCLANQGKPRGRIKPEDLAYALRMSEERMDKMVAFFEEREFLDREGEFLVPHGWDARQFISDNVTERTRKHRGNVSGTFDETFEGTPPEQIQNRTDTEAEHMPPKSPAGGVQKRAMQLPEGWMPSESLLTWAGENGIERAHAIDETEQFRDHWTGKGETRKDWDASWRTWMRNSKKWGAPAAKSGSNGRPLNNDEKRPIPSGMPDYLTDPAQQKRISPEKAAEIRAEIAARKARS